MPDTVTRYECDACGYAVVLSDLIPMMGDEHWCRCCVDRANASTSRLKALYDFAFGAPEDAFTMPIEQVDAELREAGIDPDEVTRRVVDRLAEAGIELPGKKRPGHSTGSN